MQRCTLLPVFDSRCMPSLRIKCITVMFEVQDASFAPTDLTGSIRDADNFLAESAADVLNISVRCAVPERL